MDISTKKRAVNIGFGVGIALVVLGIFVIWLAPPVWSGWATFAVVAGGLSALTGFVFALIPARDRT